MEVNHVRAARPFTMSRTMQFLAQERITIDEGYAGDILGVWDGGNLRIGDTLGRGRVVRVRGGAALLPRALRPGDAEGPAEAKAAQEGARAAVRRGGGPALLRPPPAGARPDPGRRRRPAVRGDRASARVGVQGRRSTSGSCRTSTRAGSKASPSTPEKIERGRGANCVVDAESRPIVLFENDWALRKAIEDNPHLRFLAAVQPARGGTRQ